MIMDKLVSSCMSWTLFHHYHRFTNMWLIGYNHFCYNLLLFCEMYTFVCEKLMLWFCKLIDALQAGASQFEASAGKLKRKFWWKNCKVCTVHMLLRC